MDSKKSRGLLLPYSPVVKKKVSKKGRYEENQEAPDRISSLPDYVLCHILSFLSTKYAVGTSVLSTRWKDLFVSVPVLDFDDALTRVFAPFRNEYDPSPLINRRFSNFVRRVLSLHKVMRIPKFSLKCVKYDYEPSDVCSWICAAIARNVQELEVATCLIRGGSLPSELLEYKSLVVLKIYGEFEIPLSDSVCLPLLKTLHLVDISLRLESTTWRISLHFPALEDLLLERFLARGKVVDISIPSLKRLELIVAREFRHIVLNAPALDYLSYKINPAVGFSVSELNSLVSAHVGIYTFGNDYGLLDIIAREGTVVSDDFPDFVNMLHNVQFLTLSAATLEAIEYSYCSLPTFHNLIRLEITGDYGWQPVSYLLESAPFLQYLKFERSPRIHAREYSSDDEYSSDAECILCATKGPPRRERSYWYATSDSEEDGELPIGGDSDSESEGDVEEHLCLSLHMKEIEIKNFRGFCDEYTICKYFLTKAKVLGKLIVHSLGEVEQQLETSRKLLAFPRSSTTCQVVLNTVYRETSQWKPKYVLTP